MNFYEKLAMVLVPSMGLVAILYFFSLYLPSVENDHLYDTQRLRGNSSITNNHSKPNVTRSVNSGNNGPNRTNSSAQQTKLRNKRITNDYVKWSGDKPKTYMQESLKQRRYTQTTNYSQPVNTYPTNDIQAQKAKQKRLLLIAQAKQKKNILEQECTYFETMKDRIEERMRRGYKASQYNRLEGKRKYWAKQYSDNCFSGYRYPR